MSIQKTNVQFKTTQEPDKGPWQVDVWGYNTIYKKEDVVLQSDNFKHDVALVINGDFKSLDEKLEYASALCEYLNGKTK